MLTADAIVALIQSQGKTVLLDLEQGTLPVRFHKGSPGSRVLIVTFHGAVDRSSRDIPAFTPAIPDFMGISHQLAISDPAMGLPGDHAMAWYTGYQGFPLQALLPDVITQIAQALSVEKLIFFGSSGGGFAALYYARQAPGSLALVGNPQTAIRDYYPGHISRYRAGCFPSDEASLPPVCEDVRPLYADAIDNTVIYTQNPTDHFHLFNHMAPFLAGVAKKATRERILLDVSFSGTTGHGPEHRKLKRWLQTALLAPTWQQSDLYDTYQALTPATAPAARPVSTTSAAPPPARSAKVSGASVPPAPDLHLADLLRNVQLKP